MANKIRDVMTQNPVTLPVTAPVAEAARLMRDEDIGDVLAADEQGRLVGIVTDRDIVIRAIADGGDCESVDLGRVCTQNVVTVSPDDDVDEAIELMEEKAIRRVVVVEDGKPVGIVTLGDLAIERDPDSVLGQVSAAPANQ
jgi:CBS domain-containing protein